MPVWEGQRKKKEGMEYFTSRFPLSVSTKPGWEWLEDLTSHPSTRVFPEVPPYTEVGF